MEKKVPDKIIKGFTRDGYIKCTALDSTETVKEAVKIHNFSITNRMLMGRLISATLLLSGTLKNEKDVVTIRIESDGVANGAVVTAKSNGNVKCLMPNPTTETPPHKETGTIDVKAAIGNGVLKIIKDLGMKAPYVGNVELKYGEIAEDMAYYFYQSEQIPTAIGLGILLDEKGNLRKAGGYLIQLLPETPDHIIDQLEGNLKSFPNLSDMLDMGYDIVDLMKDFLLKGFDLQLEPEESVQYHCSCSHDKFRNALKMLGKDELQKAISDKEKLNIVCHFCNTKYSFSADEVTEVIGEM